MIMNFLKPLKILREGREAKGELKLLGPNADKQDTAIRQLITQVRQSTRLKIRTLLLALFLIAVSRVGRFFDKDGEDIRSMSNKELITYLEDNYVIAPEHAAELVNKGLSNIWELNEEALNQIFKIWLFGPTIAIRNSPRYQIFGKELMVFADEHGKFVANNYIAKADSPDLPILRRGMTHKDIDLLRQKKDFRLVYTPPHIERDGTGYCSQRCKNPCRERRS